MTCAGDPSGTDSGHGLSWSGDESLHVFCRDMSGWPNPRQRTWVFDVFTSSEAVACKDETDRVLLIPCQSSLRVRLERFGIMSQVGK